MAEMSRCMQIRLEQQASQCMLCYDAPCTAVCDAGADPAAMVRSVRFENLSGAAESMKAADCAACAHGCERACSKKIPLAEMAAALPKSTASKPADLSIAFCGVPCINPFFLSSSVVASSYEMCARALEQGWGGIVFKTIGFYQPKEVSPRFDTVSREGYPFLGFRNLEQISDHTLEENLACLQRLKQNYPDRVIVASIMGETEDEWTKLAQMATDAGCDIIECNFSCPQMTVEGMGSDVGTNVQLVKAFTAAVKRGTALPVLAKMTPNITDMTGRSRSRWSGSDQHHQKHYRH
jgi:dihydropyrimidine dehydrogenase (NAD+) subunit PreA